MTPDSLLPQPRACGNASRGRSSPVPAVSGEPQPAPAARRHFRYALRCCAPDLSTHYLSHMQWITLPTHDTFRAPAHLSLARYNQLLPGPQTVTNYTLDVLPADQNSEGKVVGMCEAGAKKIVYTRK